MKNLYLIDIDGVIADFTDNFCNYFNRLGFHKLKHNQLAKTPLEKYIGVDELTYKSFKHLFRQSGQECLGAKVIKGSKKFINLKYKQGHRIIIWTSRPLEEYPEMKKHTKQWLDKNKIKYHKLVFTERGFDKEMFLYQNTIKEIETGNYNKTIMIDDRVMLKSVSEFVDEIFIFNQPYNQKLKGRRINSLLDLK